MAEKDCGKIRTGEESGQPEGQEAVTRWQIFQCMVEYRYKKSFVPSWPEVKICLLARRKKNEFNRVAAIYKFKARIPKFYFYTAKFRNVYEKRDGSQRLATQVL